MKASKHRPRHSRRLLFGLLAFSAALILLAMTSARVFADSVNIYDNAHVLDVAAVTNQASQLSYPVNIYTTNTFTGSTTDFDQATAKYIGPNDSNLIVINIDTVHRHLAIVGGTQVPLSNDQYATAIQAFKDTFNEGDYTGATIAALQSLNTALVPPPPDTSNNGFPPNGQVDPGQVQTFTNNTPDLSSVVPFIFTVFAILFVLFILKALASSASRRSRRSTVARGVQPLDATPFEAGAIGTMVGYELGREEAERQNRENIQQQMFNNNTINNFPGGNIGGGAGGDFGGGNMGGGGNIGGGSSGNF
jgi:uncharacterized membrane protein YgcG